MTSLEIANIQNEVLRHAAEVADLNDNTTNSGKLDQKELSVFIREAVKSDCNMAEITEVCNQVGVEHATDDVKTSMKKLNQLQKLEKELEYQNNILKKRYDEIDSIETKHNLIVGGSATIGGIVGAAGLCLLASTVSLPAVLIGGIVGGAIGLLVGDAISSEDVKARDYKSQASPIEDKVYELERQMQEIENSL